MGEPIAPAAERVEDAKVDQALRLVSRCEQLLLNFSAAPKPADLDKLARTLSASEALTDRILGSLGIYNEILEKVSPALRGAELDYELIKAFAFKFRCFVPEDLKTQLRDGEIVEIYDTNMIQVYRNPEFFKFCNYSLDDLLIHEWYMLYERTPEVTETLLGHARTLLTTSTKQMVLPDNTHYLKEIMLEKPMTFEVRHRFVSRIEGSSGQPMAVLATLSAREVTH